MTFRSRPVQQSRRRVRRNDSRRVIYITLTMTLAVIVSLGLMGGVLFAGWYGNHWANVATVSGEGISKDTLMNRAAMNSARYDRQSFVYTALRNQGKITPDELASFQNTLASSKDVSTLYNDALSQLEAEAVIRQFAAKNNISVTNQQVDDQVKTDSTIPEMRRVKIIAMVPEADPPGYVISLADQTAAHSTLQSLHDQVASGALKWDDADKKANGEGIATPNTVGDIGLTTKDSLSVDPDLADAIFALKKDGVTEVFKGSDGSFRFATVTDIVPPYTDSGWENAVSTGGEYRNFARAEALRKAVENWVEAKYVTGVTTQRHVFEIGAVSGIGGEGSGEYVHVKMMIFAPNHDSSSTGTAGEKAWADAKTLADKIVAQVRADPSTWTATAKDTTINDDIYFNTAGGELPWVPETAFGDSMADGNGGLSMKAVGDALFADGLTTGQILDPIKIDDKGYVVVQYLGKRPAPADRIATAQLNIASGLTTFEQEVAAISEAPDAPESGDMGWVSPYMLDKAQEDAIFATPLNQISVMVKDNGYYLYKVVAEEKRTPDKAQQAKLKGVVFNRWLTELRATATIWSDSVTMTALSSPTPLQ